MESCLFRFIAWFPPLCTLPLGVDILSNLLFSTLNNPTSAFPHSRNVPVWAIHSNTRDHSAITKAYMFYQTMSAQARENCKNHKQQIHANPYVYLETLVTENYTSPVLVEERSNKTFAVSKIHILQCSFKVQFCFIWGLKCYESSAELLLPLKRGAEMSQFYRHASEL